MLEAIMSKVVVFLLTVLFVLQYDNVKGNPLLTHEHLVNIDVNRNARLFPPIPKDWPSFHNSWSLPKFPSFSVTSLFKDDDDDITVLKKKITALEESQKEVLELLRQYTTASKTHCNDKVIVTNDGMQPGASDIADDKNEGTTEGIQKNQAQSISATINGDNTDAVPTNTGKESAAPTEVEEKKETPLKNDDTQTHVVLNGNEESETTEANSEKAGSTEKPEVENSDATQELAKPQYNHSMEKNEQPGSVENDTIKSNTLAIHQDGGESGVKVEDSEEQTQTSGNEGAGENAPIIAVVKPSNSDTNVKED